MTFSEDRMSWSLKYQEQHAIEYYKDHWGVRDTDIFELDAEGAENNLAQLLDFSGWDKIVWTDDAMVQVAQRFRRPRNSGVDFSLRSTAGGEQASEYDKLIANYQGLGSVPGVYAFGITTGLGVSHGFRDFYLIDLELFLEKLLDGGITSIGEFPNRDGSKAKYYSLDTLKRNGCIIRHWGREDDPVSAAKARGDG